MKAVTQEVSLLQHGLDGLHAHPAANMSWLTLTFDCAKLFTLADSPCLH